MGAIDIPARKPTATILEQRFQEFMADPRFGDIGPWELNDYGEIVVSPVRGDHGRAQVLLATELERQFGGRSWIEQAIRRADGPPCVPDVLWADRSFYELHKAAGLLPSAPRLCVEIASESNSIERLREKCMIYCSLGAQEAWIIDPTTRLTELYSKDGRREASVFQIDLNPF